MTSMHLTGARAVLATPVHTNERDKSDDFRAYDIRGTHPDQLNSWMVETLGQAIGTYAKHQGQTTVVTARDGRLSGPASRRAKPRVDQSWYAGRSI